MEGAFNREVIMKRRSFLLVLILLVVPCIPWADLMVECTHGCEDCDANRSVNLS